ncbi:MAG: Tol-Pal system protein TolB [Chlamydiia bacterium]|nr:Tol-Pal system protein TolB [Chlamydiia bacterium]MCH9618555.1 Tol-Pal system protein TolB [Chlamydiia bacterium]MCH9624263.1 Tol-Pal system protein TolB [Chlamydiia bacterium]
MFSQEIEVTLPTRDKEISIYITTCRAKDYNLSSLVNTITGEDFLVDGRAVIVEKNESLLTLETKTGEDLYSDKLWKQNGIDYVIRPVLTQETLTYDIFSVRKGTIKTLSAIELNKDKDANIFTLHKVSDFIMEEIFGEKGIASKRILYSYKPSGVEKDMSKERWNAEIYETDSLGYTNRRITYDNSYSISPEFIANTEGKRDYEFIYVTYKIGQPQIYHGKKDGSRAVSLIKLRGNQLLPKPSSDGKYISFVSDASGRSDVFLQPMNKLHKALGRPMQIYSGNGGTAASPHLSPDNKHMVFVSDKSGHAKIYIADIEETISARKPPKLSRLKCPCTECTAPCFSPDGTKIAFSGKINGRRQIWLYDISQKKAYQLTSGSEDKENPCFGSGGRHIVYNTTFPSTDLYLLSIEKKHIRRLTKGSGDKHYPAFEK